MVDQRSWVHMLSVQSRGCVWEIDVWVLPALLQRLKGWGGQPVSAQTIHRTLHQIGQHGCNPRRKPLLKMMRKKACKQFAEDKQTKKKDYWNYVLWTDETNINLFGSDGVKRVWWQPCEEYKDKCVLPSQAWWWECHGLGLHECCRGATVHWVNHECQHVLWHTEAEHDPLPFGDWAAGQYSNITTTALLNKLRVKVICGASSNGRWRSTRSLTSTSSVMSSWRSGRGLQWQPVKLWWTPCPRRLRQCWKIMVAKQNIDTLGPIWTFSLRGVLTFVVIGLDIKDFEGTANVHCYTSCTLTTLHCRKV